MQNDRAFQVYNLFKKFCGYQLVATDKERITFYVQPEVKQELEMLASEAGQTLNAWIAELISDRLQDIKFAEIESLRSKVSIPDDHPVIPYDAPEEWMAVAGYSLDSIKGSSKEAQLQRTRLRREANLIYSYEIALRAFTNSQPSRGLEEEPLRLNQLQALKNARLEVRLEQVSES